MLISEDVESRKKLSMIAKNLSRCPSMTYPYAISCCCFCNEALWRRKHIVLVSKCYMQVSCNVVFVISKLHQPNKCCHKRLKTQIKPIQFIMKKNHALKTSP